MKELRELLEGLIGINEEEWTIFVGQLSMEEFTAKSRIINQGTIARKIYFIEQGLLRTYQIKEGKDVSTYFACDNQFISTYASFITQTPSHENLEAIEDCVLFSLSHHGFTRLFEYSVVFEKLGRILAEKNYLCVLDRTLLMQTKTAKEKYLDFIKDYDRKIVRRTPQHMIASFLGIAPESLSRVRRQLVTS